MTPRIAIIGGGCAGLAAGATLARAGLPATLFEAAPALGGRARGIDWRGQRLDNGQHILLGAYRETLSLLQDAGLDLDSALLRLPLQLIQHPGFALRATPYLPAPLHVLAGALCAHGLGLAERCALLGLMGRLAASGFRIPEDVPLSEFLRRQRQPARLIRLLWEPICLAALNTPLGVASTRVFLNVLRASFTGRRGNSDLLLPRADLSRLLAEPLAEQMRAAGGAVHLGSAVNGIVPGAAGFTVATARQHEDFSHVVLAVPPARAAALLAGIPKLAPLATQCGRFEYQPIYTMYLQYPPTARLPAPMLGLSGGHLQWLFDRGALAGQPGLLAAVISAAGPHQALPQPQLAEHVAAEVAAAFPALPAPLWHKVVAEKRATFACTPDLDRPPNETALPQFYLAGDYTAGDYPATIEGAVISGRRCARLILEQTAR